MEITKEQIETLESVKFENLNIMGDDYLINYFKRDWERRIKRFKKYVDKRDGKVKDHVYKICEGMINIVNKGGSLEDLEGIFKR